jgi:hypothetical protein
MRVLFVLCCAAIIAGYENRLAVSLLSLNWRAITSLIKNTEILTTILRHSGPDSLSEKGLASTRRKTKISEGTENSQIGNCEEVEVLNLGQGA